MILDAELIFAKNADLKASFTSAAIDLGQKNPDLGMCTPLFLVLYPGDDGVGMGTVTVNLQDSDDGTSFATILSTGAMKVAGLTQDVALKFPTSHRRYVRVTTTVTGTVSAFTGTIAIADNFDVNAGLFRDEVEIGEPDEDAAKIDLTSQVKGILPVVNGGTGKATATA